MNSRKYPTATYNDCTNHHNIVIIKHLFLPFFVKTIEDILPGAFTKIDLDKEKEVNNV